MKYYVAALILVVITAMAIPVVSACAPGDPDEGTNPCVISTDK